MTPVQLADALKLSRNTVSRWLSGATVPTLNSCRKIIEYCGMHAPDTSLAEWPEFREYASIKYPDELDEDIITMIEDLIERKRSNKYRNE